MTHPRHPSPAVVAAERARFEDVVAGRTLCSEFRRGVARWADRPALRGPGEVLTWDGYARRVAEVAGGLRRLGLGAPGRDRGEPVAILCRNRPEFHVLDVATLFAGGIPFSLYASSPPEQLAYVLGHSRAAVVVVEDAGFLARVRSVADRLPELRHIVLVDGDPEPGVTTLPELTTLAELTTGPPLDLAEAATLVRPEDPATVIYTSGTTGAPKGVVLTHHNICYAMTVHFAVMDLPMAGLRQLSYLPMAHIGERQVTHYYHLLGGTDVTTCANLADLGPMMAAVRPQWWFCAPRLWEKLRAGIEASIPADPGPRTRFEAARSLGWRVHALRNAGSPVPGALAREWAHARDEVIGPVLARYGLADIVMAITGAAPLGRETLEFFLSCGVAISDVYGASETSGFMSWSPHHVVPGTSGIPLPGLEMRLADPGGGAGEIEVRAPSVFAGYLHDPDRTAEAFTPDGYYRTGDIGHWDAEGNLAVIDRVTEILVPTSGHKVSPVLLENAVKAQCPLVGQACAIGDNRPHVTLLAVLDPDLAAAWARSRGITATGPELACHPAVLTEVDAAITRVNAGLAGAERIRAHLVLGEPWLPDTDLLTPTAKLKRRGVLARFAAEIDRLYAVAS